MTLDGLTEYCMAKPGAEETYPWGPSELVTKVGGKAFAFIWLDGGSVSLKCGRDSDEAAEWRQRYPDDITISGYIGRHGWNSVRIGGAVPTDEILELVDMSYDMVVAKLPKSRRPALPQTP